jgi:hypothetical protein
MKKDLPIITENVRGDHLLKTNAVVIGEINQTSYEKRSEGIISENMFGTFQENKFRDHWRINYVFAEITGEKKCRDR